MELRCIIINIHTRAHLFTHYRLFRDQSVSIQFMSLDWARKLEYLKESSQSTGSTCKFHTHWTEWGIKPTTSELTTNPPCLH